ncbi:MAG: hypothetical protein HGA95_02920 [Caldiserica bacterium]|nr:hypothetical protein [Caldisericota bacterium]
MDSKTVFAIPRYSDEVARNMIAAVYGVEADDAITVGDWWKRINIRLQSVIRFQKAAYGLRKATPEKEDAVRVYKQYLAEVNEICVNLEKILSTSNEGFVMNTWFRPMLSYVFSKPSKKASVIAKTAQMIRDFENHLETDRVGQIIAVAEAIVESDESNLYLVRLKVAQWAFEELLGLFKKYELDVKLGGIDELTTVDEPDMERFELENALACEPWKSVVREKNRRIFHRIREAMDRLKFEEKTKRRFNRVFDYATGHVGLSVSAMDILNTCESAWQGIKEDDTLREFWQAEQEALEEKCE